MRDVSNSKFQTKDRTYYYYIIQEKVVKNLKQNEYIKTTGLIFAVIAVLHVVRLFSGWEVEIGDFEIPVWLSFIGVAVAGFLAYTSYKLKK